MINGLYFYWISWTLWVIVTFFMKKNTKRTLLSYWILVSIIVSNAYFTFDYYDISLTFISILIGGFLLFPHISRMVYHMFCTFTMMIGYASILIWEGQAPIWLFMPRFVLIPLICIFMICILVRGLYPRITVALVGICSGEFLYSHMLSNYYISYVVGEMIFFDTLSLILFIIIGIEWIRKLKRKLFLILRNYKTNVEVAK
ncbi:hypothetical protein ACFSTA_13195 [Ornithinibacillus salinisoli]|uniref:Integral membrane protein n=1 Tax=Ornithinibacillus salinisoli TaxID=1848459 RepID=A0ABW4W2W1_9BACI